MRTVQAIAECASSELCAKCGIPFDARYFDTSSFADAPDAGAEVVLARFELPAEYCGVLEYFSQFTDAWADDPQQIETPNVEWSILANRRPFDPYLRWQHIVNPWGYGSFPIALRLEENMTLELVAQGTGSILPDIPFSTTIASAIIGGTTPQLVTPASLSGIKPGMELLVVDTPPNAATQETVTVISVLPPSFAAMFQNAHRGLPVLVSGASKAATKVTRVGGRLVGRYWYNAAFGDVVHRGR